jgi:ribokinase
MDYLITHDGRSHNGVVGGNALYSAVGAAIWQEPVGLWGRCGENYPQAWLDELSQWGIVREGVVVIPGWQEHRTFFAYMPDGRRDDMNPADHYGRIHQPMPEALAGYTHSTLGQDDPEKYEPLAVRPEDWPDAYGAAAAVHLAPISLCTHRHVPPFLRQQGVSLITLDPGERYMVPERLPYIRELLPEIDFFLPSRKEIWSLFGEEADLRETAVTLHEWGAPVVIIKMGAEGVLLFDGQKHCHLRPYHTPNDSRVVDVTGAGDAFCGGLVAGLVKGLPLETAVRCGMVSASLVIEGYGALYALSRKAEAAGRLQEMENGEWRMENGE